MTDYDKKFQEARKTISDIDKEIAVLFEKRMEAAVHVAEYKKVNGVPIEDTVRENHLIETNSMLVKNDEIRSYYVNFLKNTMKLSKDYQHKLIDGTRVAFSGVKGAFAEIAVKRIFPDAVAVPYSDFKSAYKAVENGECECAVLPIENSFEGDVARVMDLTYFGSLFINGVYDMAKELGLNSEKYALWEDIIENFSDFPTFIKKGKKCFRYSKFGIRWRDENTVGLQHIYPASQIGLSSDEKLLKIAKNTYFINDRRLDDNGSNSYLPAGARIGVDPEFLIEGIHQNIKEFCLPNGLFRHYGGGIENLTTIPATINEMLMQSFEGVIRLFPCWNKKSNASFTNLRADGAFLVSAELKNEKISSVKIKSLKGRLCNVDFADIKSAVRESDNKEIEFKRNGNIISFETKENETYLLL